MTHSWNKIIYNFHTCGRKFHQKFPSPDIQRNKMNSQKYAISIFWSIHCHRISLYSPIDPNICDSFSSTEMSKKPSGKLISIQLSLIVNWAYSLVQSASFSIYLPTTFPWYWGKNAISSLEIINKSASSIELMNRRQWTTVYVPSYWHSY